MICVRRSLAMLLGVMALLSCPTPGLAQKPAAPDRCLAVSEAPRLIQPAQYRPAALKPTEVRLTFVGHATWLIESPGAVKIATDYNDYLRPPVLPDVATMNRAHTSHFSMFPDPGIKHVLRGWDPEGGVPRHDLTVADVRVRNVATNIRDWGGGYIRHGNSIFIFNPYTLNRFLDTIRSDFPTETATEPSIVVSQPTLPSEPKVLVLPGR